MGIVPTFNQRNVERSLKDVADSYRSLIVRNLSIVGEQAVIAARNEHERNYTDRTGNLRASIGYVIAYNGKTLGQGGFDPEAASSRTDGQTGAREGREFAKSLTQEFSSGYVLIVVAGMNYGVYVERRAYNVITFTEITAREEVEKLMNRLYNDNR